MIEFHSGSSNAVNSKAAVIECVEAAFTDGDKADCKLLVIHSTVGHNFAQMMAGAKEACPDAEIIGCTGSGVIGREGVSEAMRAMAVMAITGDEFAVTATAGLNGANSAALGEQVAGEIKAANPDINMIYILSAGLDLSGDKVIEGIESVFGGDVPIFGATAADNGKAKGTFQFHGQTAMENGLILVGFSDPTLEVLSGVHHGSIPVDGAIFEVTKSKDNQVIELDGIPAWPALLARFGLPPETTELSETLPITGLGEVLTDREQAEYDNPQILRVPIKVSEDHLSFYLPISVSEGSKFQLMQRDEQYIFEGLDRLMERMQTELEGRRPVAVFHADCMARGRFTFNRVLKDEIIAKMQYPLCGDDAVPWLGVYGFSEYCRFAGKNHFHSYTTSLFPIVRRKAA
ncbi:MAG: FIST C-terminal domain-containing protein [Alphaproteobacteria bacterium]|nr:FIST C-terminal domain-containing protein [Alphaproteobacteria bacterium]